MPTDPAPAIDANQPAAHDPVRLVQRLFRYVLVPVAILGGSVIIVRDSLERPQEVELLVRLVAAASLGGLIGIERQLSGHWAGLRTHMMVSLAAALFMLAGVRGSANSDTTRVIQGIAAGIGFLGAGTILKLSDRLEVIGLTTASSVWLAAAVGTAAGLALYTLAIAATVLSLIVLAILLPFERRLLERRLGQDLLNKAGIQND